MENKQMHNVLLPTKMYDLQLARLDEPIEILYHQDGKNIVRKATQQLNVHNTCTR